MLTIDRSNNFRDARSPYENRSHFRLGNSTSLNKNRLLEDVSNKMDRKFRIYTQGKTTNNKVYKESTVFAKVNTDLRNLRNTKHKVFYERVPDERVDYYKTVMQADEDRSVRLTNNRFPELAAAREAFLGKEGVQGKKREQAEEVCKFAEVVEKLA